MRYQTSKDDDGPPVETDIIFDYKDDVYETRRVCALAIDYSHSMLPLHKKENIKELIF